MSLAPNYTGHRKDVVMLNDYFQAFKELDVIPKVIIEFGVAEGGSLKLWNDLFAPKKIIGYDFNGMDWDNKYPIEVRPFNQRDINSIKKAKAECNVIADFIIDDCCHDGYCIIDTLLEFWDKLRPGGVYIIEDYQAAEEWMMEHNAVWADKFAEARSKINPSKFIHLPTIEVLVK